MTRPDNAGPAESPLTSEDPDVVAAEQAQENSPRSGVPSSPPRQRQRGASGDEDPKTVTLQVGAPEHARSGIREQGVREQTTRQLVGSRGFPPGASPPADSSVTRNLDHEGAQSVPPTTVRVGGYTPPERVPPVAVPSAAVSSAGSRAVRVPRRTSLQLQRLDPWSVLKLSLVLSVAGFLVWLVAVGVLYGILSGMGVWDQINGTYSDFTQGNNPVRNTQLISGGRVFGISFVIGLVNIVLLTALATVGSLIYNIAADFVGGVEVTLSEPD